MKRIFTLTGMLFLILTQRPATAQTNEIALVWHTFHQSNAVPESAPRPTKLDLSAGLRSASFPGLAEYLLTHLAYPELARENSVEGTLSLEVVLSREGEVIEARVVKSLGYGCDETALQVVRDMPTWIPASNHGVPVKSKSRLDIDFHLR